MFISKKELLDLIKDVIESEFKRYIAEEIIKIFKGYQGDYKSPYVNVMRELKNSAEDVYNLKNKQLSQEVDSLHDEIPKLIKEGVQSEKFIDDIIQRITNKQLTK